MTTEVERCAECGASLAEGDARVETDDGLFCGTCFENLKNQVQRALQEQSTDINYPMALAGGLAGGAIGALVWWGFTVVTKIAFGLVAVVIGFAVGKGVTVLAGGKRSTGLQFLSTGVALLSFGYATYLVNRSFIQQAFAAEGETIALPFLPDTGLFMRVVSTGFEAFDVVFLGIVLWQAWKMPAPIRIAD